MARVFVGLLTFVVLSALALALRVSPVAAQAAGSRPAIDAALDRAYPKERDFRFELKPNADGSDPPLAEVVVYRAQKPVPHWHYVTYGLTELDEKVSSDAKRSGFGVEYTLRIVDDAKEPPGWPLNLLRWLAARVWETRNPYDANHSMNFPEGMLNDVSKGVEGLAFIEDTTLRTIRTKTGAVTFVNAVPLTADEYALACAWDLKKVVAEIKEQQKDVLWHTGRTSILTGPRRDVLLAMVAKEGSSQGLEFVEMPCDAGGVTLDRIGLSVMDGMLRHRLAHGRVVTVRGTGRELSIEPGAWGLSLADDKCKVRVPKREARALADELLKVTTKATIERPGGLKFHVAVE